MRRLQLAVSNEADLTSIKLRTGIPEQHLMRSCEDASNLADASQQFGEQRQALRMRWTDRVTQS